VYDDHGVLEFAIRYTDKRLIRRCRKFIAALYKKGEPISTFFRREVAYLSPARPDKPAIPHDYLSHTGRPSPIRS
jgi:hypothetical protein